MQLYTTSIRLLNAKVYYCEANMWIAAEDAGKSIEEAYQVNNQSVDELGKVICLAHLAEARVPDCPYKSKEERASAKYPCSDYEEVRT